MIVSDGLSGVVVRLRRVALSAALAWFGIFASPAVAKAAKPGVSNASSGVSSEKRAARGLAAGKAATTAQPARDEAPVKSRDAKPGKASPKTGISKKSSKDSSKSRAAALSKLGPLSVGHPHAGYLVNAVKMPSSPEWVLTVPSHGYGTQETVDALGLCIRAVHAQFPGSDRVMLGSLSAERGGLLPPHKSHRTGRDADVYFFRKPGARWVKAATEDDIDLPRTWALLRCFVTDTDVEMILIDRKVQGWLEAYARSIDEPAEWVDELFHDQKGTKSAIVRHVPGHVAHMHVRFVSAKARRAAVKVYDELVASGLVSPGVAAITHEVVKGDTLSQLAERYKCSVGTIQKLNGLSSTVIKIGQRLTLQKAVDVRGAREAVYQPARRLPPKLVTPARPPADEAKGADAQTPSAERNDDRKLETHRARTSANHKPADTTRIARR